jgi:branched-chain amino acid transport system ATP-binding protein
MIEVEGLEKAYGALTAVQGLSFRVRPGEVVGLVGPNGAGKTTLFILLTGFLPASAGRIEVAGQDVTGLPPEKVARLGVARSFQVTSLFPAVTARAHLEVALQAGTDLGRRFWRSDRLLARFTGRALELLDQVGLAERAEAPAGSLPYGQKRALELALALALDPRVLLLDEPTAGMGLEDVDRTVALVDRIRAGRTVVLVEHNMSVVGSLADTVTVLQRGRVLVEGPYGTVRTDPRVVEAYLGAGVA